MDWKIPNIPPSRELDCTSCYPALKTCGTHVACSADFCLTCSADLRVKRLRVSTVSYSDARRLHICEAVSNAYFNELAAAECDRLEISRDDRERLSELYAEGIAPEVLYLVCELADCKLVGITADGVFLYAKPDDYEVGPDTLEVKDAALKSPERNVVIQVGPEKQVHRRNAIVYRRV
jgi:hypothetical protein